MAKTDNIMVIGNGFDLALRLKTKYVDFVNSPLWPIQAENQVRPGEENNLFNYIAQFTQQQKENLGAIRWIDLEELLLNYALSKSKSQAKFEVEKEIVDYDLDVYNQLKRKFTQYIVDYVNGSVTGRNGNTFPIKDIMDAIVENGTFTKVYSFNYTKTAKNLEFLFNWKPKVIHIHGLAHSYSNEIVLGTSDNQDIPRDYRFLMKSNDPAYVSHDMNDDLFKAEQIIVYGLSFGPIDFIYFESFLRNLIKTHKPGDKKTKMYIFTYDDKSLQAIKNTFQDNGINLRELHNCVEVHFYRTLDAGMPCNGIEPTDDFKQHMLKTKPKQSSIASAEVKSFMDNHYGPFEY